MVLEVRGSESRGHQGCAPSEGSRAGSFLGSFGFWRLLGALSISWLVAVSLQSLPVIPWSEGPSVCLCHHMAFSSVCVCVLFPHKDTNYIGFKDPPESSNDLILTNSIYKDPVAKEGHVHGYQGLGLQRTFLGDTNATHNTII